MKLNQYPDISQIQRYVEMIGITRSIQYEYQAAGIQPVLDQVENQLKDGLERLKKLSPDLP